MYDSVCFASGGFFRSRGEWRHPARTIDTHEIICAVRGNFAMTVGEGVYALSPGDVLHIEPGTPHSGLQPTEEPISFYWIHFTASGEDALPPPWSHPENGTQTEFLCRGILHYANTEGYPEESVILLLRVLLIELGVQADGYQNPDRLTAAVCEWVRANCDLPLRVSDVAARFHYNSDYLNSVFRRTHPEGLKAYIDAARMVNIRRDLADGRLSLRDIAEKYGFGEYKYFLKFFKYHEGVSPTVYRATYYNIHENSH